MKKLILFLTLAVAAGCGFSNKTETESEPKGSPTKAKVKPTLKVVKMRVNVPRLANKSAAHFDKRFGKPSKVAKITNQPALMPGEYREYRMKRHPKGLSVRFYKDRAKRFNLLLGKPKKNSAGALKRIFGIDVGKLKSAKGAPLSETWKGNYKGVEFVTAYAKRDKPGGRFVMLHAEIAK